MTLELSLDPETLLAQAQAKSVQAQGALLELYRNYLMLLARLHMGPKLRGKVDPTDIVQETFLKAHRDFPQFRGRTEPQLLAWLRQLLATSLAMTVRHYFGAQRRDVRLECALEAELGHSSQILDRGLVARDSSPSQRAARREQAVLLADALEQLSPDYREVIVLRHMKGLSFAEAAERMERSLDSVKKLWARALVQMRRFLGYHHEAHA
jgi:RNA polymerase sigma-70 factor (ECF subfamily)